MSVAGTMLPLSAQRPGDASLSAPAFQSMSTSSNSRLKMDSMPMSCNRPKAVLENGDAEANMQELDFTEVSPDIASEFAQGGA